MATIRVGAVDCGTNSIRLLVADVEKGTGMLTEVTRQMQVVRLGEGVDASGLITPQALARTLAVAGDYATRCASLGVTSVRFVATSATRDAANGEEFLTGVEEAFGAFGVRPEVVDGDVEAALSFSGATGHLRAAGAATPYLVVDLGGGSTELVRGADRVEQSRSLDVGCVRMTERHLRSDPPTEEEVWAGLADITGAIDEAALGVDLTDIGTLVGLAGSVTTVTAHALGLAAYHPERIHGAELPVQDVIDACNDLLLMTRAQRAARPFMHPGRVDVIGAGALIWRTLVQRLQRDSGIRRVRTSEHDILDGIALSLVG